jgi:hypothetical protein
MELVWCHALKMNLMHEDTSSSHPVPREKEEGSSIRFSCLDPMLISTV